MATSLRRHDKADSFVVLQSVRKTLEIGGRYFCRCRADKVETACGRTVGNRQFVGLQELGVASALVCGAKRIKTYEPAPSGLLASDAVS